MMPYKWQSGPHHAVACFGIRLRWPYASKEHRDFLAQHGIRQSMSRKGNCWDNAVSESFFHTLKTELTYHYRYSTRE